MVNEKDFENGFYFVIFQDKATIARYINGSWTMCGNVNTYTDDDFEDIDYNNLICYL